MSTQNENKDNGRYTYDIINKDSWLNICKNLHNKDVCQLRATCKHLYKIITSLDQYWYLEYEWFLIRTGQYEKSMCCSKVHNRAMSTGCIVQSKIKTDYPQIWAKYVLIPSWQRDRYILTNMKQNVKDWENVLKKMCQYNWHFSWSHPKTKQKIVISDDYRKRKGKCIFWYLIACYRHRRNAVKDDAWDIPRTIKSMEYDISTRIPAKIKHYQKALEHNKKRIVELKTKQKKTKVLNDNQIFFNKVAKTYKSPLLDDPTTGNKTTKKRKQNTTKSKNEPATKIKKV